MTHAMKFDASLLCRASFPAELEDDGGRCIVEVTVYRLNAVAVHTFLLDGPEPLRRHLGLSESDTYITKHDIDDLVWEGLYEKLDRVSCACCAAKNLKELRNIYNDMPDVWADLQRRQRMTKRPFKGPGKSVPELAIRFELEKKWIAEGKNVKSREFYKTLAEALREEAPAWQR